MQPSTNLLINATRKAAKFLQRDFMELEMLQSSARNTKGFCEQSFLKAKKVIHEELSSPFKYIYFSDEEYSLKDNIDNYLLVTPIEGTDNLSKGMPFFAIMITQIKRMGPALVPCATVIHFPALAEIYYAEKGAGGWLERFTSGFSARAVRLRVSSCNNLENAFICGANYPKINKFFAHSRNFGSFCYSTAALFAAGKIDILYIDTISPFLKEGLELIIKESGGALVPTERSLVAVNYNLSEKFKQLLANN